MTGLFSPCPFKREATGVDLLFHNRIISNFIVNNDRLETNLLQIFAHPQKPEWVSILSGRIFEVNVVARQKQA